MIIILKAFLSLVDSFEIIFRQETSFALQRKSQKRISSTCNCLLFISGHFLPEAGDQMFYLFIAKVQNEQGILFVHWKLA